MADVYATIANGGRWVQPRLVRGSEGPDGVFHAAPSSPSHEVVSPETAADALAHARRGGPGRHRRRGPDPRLPGGGQDGHLPQDRRLRPTTWTATSPRSSASCRRAARVVVIAVSIDEPRTVYGGVAAAPLFPEIARYAIQRLGIRRHPRSRCHPRPRRRHDPSEPAAPCAGKLGPGGSLASPSLAVRRGGRRARCRAAGRRRALRDRRGVRFARGHAGLSLLLRPRRATSTGTTSRPPRRRPAPAPSSWSAGSAGSSSAGPRPLGPRGDGPDVRDVLRPSRRGA